MSLDWWKIANPPAPPEIFVIVTSALGGSFPFLWSGGEWRGAANLAGRYLYQGDPCGAPCTEAEAAEVLETQGTTMAQAKSALMAEMVKFETAWAEYQAKSVPNSTP